MRGVSLDVRARAIIDKLDERLERQTFLEGADAPHCVAAVGAVHRFAGNFERKLDELARLRRVDCIVAELRLLRRVVRDHGLMVGLRGAQLRAARRETVQRAIKASKRGSS